MSGHDHNSPHIMSIPALLGTWFGLMVLTGLTVGAIAVDLGPNMNLVVAMVIATLKAGLVLAFFMHLLYDKRFNFMIFATSVLGVVLFVSISFLDLSEYQPDVAKRQADIAAGAQ